jgi:3-phenylpropionate/trans-cinnamate dioxygenase ferredoxin subunit
METASSFDEQDEFVAVAHIDELTPGSMKRFVVSDRALVLANIDGSFHAFEDRCLHWGVKLSNGCLEGNAVRCRAHGWKHDVVRGEIVASEPPGDEGRPVRTFKVKIRDRTVFVGGSIASPKANAAR